jgi:predicted transcriptional regulator of viral defense system
LDRAFSSRPRQSRLVFSDPSGHRFVVVAGKSTNNFGVGVTKGPAGERLLATKVERTLVDLAVRLIYCGGVNKVLEAYRAAKPVLHVERLLSTLKKLDYLYPYHQAIGFYLERAGFDAADLDLARKPGLDFDFYLTHGMEDAVYDKAWRLYYPRGI